MLPWDLEDWLTDEGDKVVRKAAEAKTLDVLESHERLLYEMWIFDTEQRNGGMSQYFCNHGLAQWHTLSRLAAPALSVFPPFAVRIDAAVAHSEDPYRAIIDSGIDLDGWYGENQAPLVTELQAVTELSCAATAILRGKLGVIEGARLLCRFRSHIPSLISDPNFQIFIAIDSEEEHLPVGDARKHWDADALAKKDVEIKVAEDFHREAAFAGCRHLLARFSFNLPREAPQW